MGEELGESITSVLNALRIIEAIAGLQPVGVSALGREVSLPKTSVQRALHTLRDAGWIRRAEGNDKTRWELTSAMFSISMRALGEYSLRDLAAAAMTELRLRTRETVQLVSRDDNIGVLIHRLDSDHPVRAFARIGSRSPLHVSASGHAILSGLPMATVTSIVARDLAEFAASPAGGLEEILRRVQVARDVGYAVNLGQLLPEIGTIASPIFGSDGKAVAALSVVIPLSRLADEDIPTYGAWVRELASGIGPVISTRS